MFAQALFHEKITQAMKGLEFLTSLLLHAEVQGLLKSHIKVFLATDDQRKLLTDGP